MKTILTYGSYDLLHHGHIRLLKRAKQLGDTLIVGLSTDKFAEAKGKVHTQPYSEREAALKETGLVDQIIPENSWEQKQLDIIKWSVDTFVMGSDWEDKFNELCPLCDVIYLPRTEGISTYQIKQTLGGLVRLPVKEDIPDKHFKPDEKVHWWMVRNPWGRPVESALECLFLQRLAKDKSVLEIGSYLGRTTLALAEDARKVVAVDPFSAQSWVNTDNIAGNKTTYKEYMENISGWDNIITEVGLSSDIIPTLKEKFDLIHIDGNHTEEGVATDIKLCLKLAKKTSLFVLHDYTGTSAFRSNISRAASKFFNEPLLTYKYYGVFKVA